MSTAPTMLSASESDAVNVSRAIFGQRTRVMFATEPPNKPLQPFEGQIVGQSHDFYLQRIVRPGQPEPQIVAHPLKPFIDLHTPLSVGTYATIRYIDARFKAVTVLLDEPTNHPGSDPHLWAANQFLTDYIQNVKKLNANVIIPQGPTLSFKGEIIDRTAANYIQELDKPSPTAPTYVVAHTRDKISPELDIGSRYTILYQNYFISAFPEKALRSTDHLVSPSTTTTTPASTHPDLNTPNLFGTQGVINEAETAQGLYTGPIASQTPTHYIQQVARHKFIRHHKDAIHSVLPDNSALAQGPLLTIRYRGGRPLVCSENCINADLNDAVYMGPITTETDTTYYQRITPSHYVAHKKDLLDKYPIETPSPEIPRPTQPGLSQGNRYYITYSQGTPFVTDITQQQNTEKQQTR